MPLMDQRGMDEFVTTGKSYPTRPEEVVTVQTLRYKHGHTPLRITLDWLYIHLHDLETLLGLKRTNIRCKTTTKIKVLDKSKNRTQGMTFVHAKHLDQMCQRSARPAKCDWVKGLFAARYKKIAASQEEQKIQKISTAAELIQGNLDRLTNTIVMVLENFWTRLPREVIKLLESGANCIGTVKKLREEDEKLRAAHAKTKTDQ